MPFAAAVFLGWFLLPSLLSVSADSPRVTEIDVDGMIHPVSAELINAGIDQAARQHSSLILIRLSTPGGLDSSMREIIEKIIASPVPVAVFVAPSGRRAACAGV